MSASSTTGLTLQVVQTQGGRDARRAPPRACAAAAGRAARGSMMGEAGAREKGCCANWREGAGTAVSDSPTARRRRRPRRERPAWARVNKAGGETHTGRGAGKAAPRAAKDGRAARPWPAGRAGCDDVPLAQGRLVASGREDQGGAGCKEGVRERAPCLGRRGKMEQWTADASCRLTCASAVATLEPIVVAQPEMRLTIQVDLRESLERKTGDGRPQGVRTGPECLHGRRREPWD